VVVHTIAAGKFHSLALKNGTMWSFGIYRYGEFGTATSNGTSNANPSPTGGRGWS
jgi:alpha-tubulin suppressor-like RCC1 family protein